jgi:hypothetical protein
MAYIRKELFEYAEEDSDVALQIDPQYVKAYSRRGMVRFKRGKYAEVFLFFCINLFYIYCFLLAIHFFSFVHFVFITSQRQKYGPFF